MVECCTANELRTQGIGGLNETEWNKQFKSFVKIISLSDDSKLFYERVIERGRYSAQCFARIRGIFLLQKGRIFYLQTYNKISKHENILFLSFTNGRKTIKRTENILLFVDTL